MCVELNVSIHYGNMYSHLQRTVGVIHLEALELLSKEYAAKVSCFLHYIAELH